MEKADLIKAICKMMRSADLNKLKILYSFAKNLTR